MSTKPGTLHYEFTGHLPAGWRLEASQTAEAFGRLGGSTQVVVFDADGKAVPMQSLVDKVVLREQ